MPGTWFPQDDIRIVEVTVRDALNRLALGFALWLLFLIKVAIRFDGLH